MEGDRPAGPEPAGWRWVTDVTRLAEQPATLPRIGVEMNVPSATAPNAPLGSPGANGDGAGPVEHFDVLIVGAGLSGIGAGVHLRTKCPTKSFVVLESRDAIGGTWDLFRYPGIRSDSDMFTLGYSFKPWTEAKAIADGPVDPQLRPRDRRRARGRRADPLQPPRRQDRVVDRGGALERHRRAHRHRRGGAAHLRLRPRLHRLLPLRRGLHPGAPRDRALRRQGRPPPALARGPGLRRQARGRDRQRRDRGHPRPGDGRAGRARDDAPALADLRRQHARAGPDRRLPPAGPPATGSPTRSLGPRT